MQGEESLEVGEGGNIEALGGRWGAFLRTAQKREAAQAARDAAERRKLQQQTTDDETPPVQAAPPTWHERLVEFPEIYQQQQQLERAAASGARGTGDARPKQRPPKSLEMAVVAKAKAAAVAAAADEWAATGSQEDIGARLRRMPTAELARLAGGATRKGTDALREAGPTVLSRPVQQGQEPYDR
jgi:hypothetical protein